MSRKKRIWEILEYEHEQVGKWKTLSYIPTGIHIYFDEIIIDDEHDQISTKYKGVTTAILRKSEHRIVNFPEKDASIGRGKAFP